MLFGTFDYLHPGHQFVLTEATKRSKKVVIVIARDTTVTKIKGRPPRMSEQERYESVKDFLPQATVVLGDSDDFLAPIRLYAPTCILLGYDQQLPPGIQRTDLPCAIERLSAFYPEKYKSSFITINN